MGTIFVMHGVVHRPEPDAFLARNTLDTNSFADYLNRRKKPFVPLAQALSGEGDALTIDDAVYACFDAALAARAGGHEVTLFVNPFNIETRLPYWFSLLNLLLDRTPRARVGFEGAEYLLNGAAAKNQFRKAVKERICRLPDEEESFARIRRLAVQLDVSECELPPFLQTISGSDIIQLASAGVQIENHGWTHCHPAWMNAGAVWANIAAGRSWLRDRVSIDARMYAVPFGESPPPDDVPKGLFDVWFMADTRFFPGRIGKRIINRVTLGRKEMLA